MRAVVKYDNIPGATEIREVPVPEINDDEVLIKVAYAGICGGDPHIHSQTMSYPPVVEVPLILGHECSGIVAAVGRNVSGVKAGDHVVPETHVGFCGECYYCRQGMFNLCKERKGLGAGAPGVFAEYVKADRRAVHLLNSETSLRKAALTEPLCIVYNSLVKHSCLKPGDTVAIIGAGSMGLLSGALAKAMGAGEVVLLGTPADAGRFEIAKGVGIRDFAYVTDHTPEEIKKRYTDGRGFDLVVDGAGNRAAFWSAIQLVRPLGEINKIGFGPEPFDRSLDPLNLMGATVNFAFSHTWDVWEKSVKLIEKNIVDVEKIVTHELALEEFETGFQLMDRQEGVKVLLKP
ncbi:zinc-dependent alcohol dehydrogenase [Bacilliculturomica massiliensis]|uniref:zinc-dependent alcohol dehydrogenase n=1 Tax=Bacilliculturomica massiliensis TaxID=1917867 RepID=UPI0013EF3ADB|nr:alcohol dehydrogenase catalytic domain-containing protein [Bacilliculturomica massiliensis]